MARKRNSLSKGAVWVIMALLLLGLAGFGTVNFSGTIQSIGSVGDKEIGVQSYFTALREELRAIEAQTGTPVTTAQALEQGADARVLSRLIGQRSLDAEAEAMGVSVGDQRLLEEILAIPAFQGLDGKFDRETYRGRLKSANLTEAEFEGQIRDEAARTLLQGAVLAGNTMPAPFSDAMVNYIAERRTFVWAVINETNLDAPIEDADAATLRAYYDAHLDRYTRPAARAISYAWLTPEMILDTIEIDEAALERLYAEREAEYNQPERRLVERLVFANEDEAASASAQIEVGGTDFETLVEDRGIQLSDVDLGDVTRDVLGDAAEAVFAAEVGAVVGPLPSSLGPALFRVNGVLPGQVITLDEVRDELTDELALYRARRLIAERAEDYNDLLAGGATLENLGAETEMMFGQIDWFNGSEDGIAAYAAFRDAAAKVQASDFPEIIELDDGGVFALRVDGEVAPRPEEFDAVAEKVADDWRFNELQTRTRALADETVGKLAEGFSFAGMHLFPRLEEQRVRTDFIDGAPADLMVRLFEMQAGEVSVLPSDFGTVILRLDRIEGPDPENAELAQIRDYIQNQAAGGIAQDLFEALTRDLRNRQTVTLDQAAINAVHAQLQ